MGLLSSISRLGRRTAHSYGLIAASVSARTGWSGSIVTLDGGRCGRIPGLSRWCGEWDCRTEPRLKSVLSLRDSCAYTSSRQSALVAPDLTATYDYRPGAFGGYSYVRC